MNLQHIYDTKGKVLGVFIPIKDWVKIKKKYVDLQLEEHKIDFELQDWQKEIIDERLADYENNPNNTISFEELTTRVIQNRNSKNTL